MSPLPAEPAAHAENPTADRVCIGTYPEASAGFEHSLVILAMGHSCWLDTDGGGSRLLVERALAQPAADELARYDRECLAWPPPPPPPAPARHPHFRLATLLWASLLLAAFWGQARFPTLAAAGCLDAAGVFVRGEWWRPLTALFLHGDSGHLLSNLIAGSFVFLAVGATFGTGWGWLLLALSAVAGNLLSAALLLPGPYQSLGASTAVFAGLGLLVGHAAVAARPTGGIRRWTRVLVPLAAGAILLALHGAGGPRVDLGAHLTGFVCGLAAGAVAATAGAYRRRSSAAQDGVLSVPPSDN